MNISKREFLLATFEAAILNGILAAAEESRNRNLSPCDISEMAYRQLKAHKEKMAEIEALEKVENGEN